MEKVSTNLIKRCKKCGEDRELSLFKYTLTRAEALARGYKAEFKVQLEGKTCNLCKKKRRPLKALRASELRSRVESGDINEATYEHILAERAKSAKERLSANMKRYWERALDMEWANHLKPLKNEIRLVTNQHFNGMRKDNKEIVAFAEAYLKALLRVQAQLAIKADNREKVDPDHDWRKDVTDAEYDEIEALELKIPVNTRIKMRRAQLLTLKSYRRNPKAEGALLNTLKQAEQHFNPSAKAQVGNTVEKLDTSWLDEL